MSKAHVDPAELRRFAQDLNRFNVELQTLLGGLNARMRALESSWRDQEQRKFAEQFDGAVKHMANFVELADQHSKILAKKANAIEEYLRQR